MAYVIVESGTPRFYSLAKLLDDNPGAVLSNPPTEAELAAYEVYEVTVEEQPTYDTLSQRVVALPLSNISGSWVLGWEVVNLTLEEIEARQTPEALLAQVDSVQTQVASVQNEVSEITGPTENQTEADKVFRAIVMSYSIPGSYPEKVAAVDSAVAAYGVNGTYTELYDHAVAALAV